MFVLPILRRSAYNDPPPLSVRFPLYDLVNVAPLVPVGGGDELSAPLIKTLPVPAPPIVAFAVKTSGLAIETVPAPDIVMAGLVPPKLSALLPAMLIVLPPAGLKFIAFNVNGLAMSCVAV